MEESLTNMEFENEEAFLIREVEADPTNYHAISSAWRLLRTPGRMYVPKVSVLRKAGN